MTRQDPAGENEGVTNVLPSAEGEAAFLLLESLIHSLLDNGALSREQAIEAISGALEIKNERLGEHDEPRETVKRSIGLLTNMRMSVEARTGTPAPSSPPTA